MKRSLFLNLFIALGLLAVTLVVYGIFYSFVQAEGTKASQLESQIAAQNNATVQAAQAKTELATLSTEQGAVGQYFVSTTNVVPFLESLQSLGTFLGSSVQVASVSANPGDPYGTLDLSLSISGTFDSVLRTIGAFEFQPYNVSLTSLSLGSGSAAGGTTAPGSALPNWNATATFIVGAQTGTSTSSTSSTATPLNELNTFGLPPTTNQPSATQASQATTTPSTKTPSTATSSAPANSIAPPAAPSKNITASSTTSTSSHTASSTPGPTPSP